MIHSAALSLLDGFDNNIAIGGRVTRADQSNSSRHAGLEFRVRLTDDLGFGERGKTLIEGLDGLLRICCEEFFGLPDVANFEIWLKEIEDIENIGNAPCEG